MTAAPLFTIACLLSVTAPLEAVFWFRNGKHRDGFLLGEGILQKKAQTEASKNVKTLWFTQKLDHFNSSDHRQFLQKYYQNDVYYKPGGPIFLQIGGESPARVGFIDENEKFNWMEQAQHFGALCFYLEHRYYGDTNPRPDVSTPNLKWLSSEQALADIAYFIESMNAKLALKTPKWITFGGSYPGCLSAWFRLKYPNLAIGAVSSSSPVEAKTNFWEYLQVVVNSLKSYSLKCVTNIQEATQIIEERINKNINISDLVTKFNICETCDLSKPLDVINFFANLFSNFAGVVQYSKDNRGKAANILTIDKVCDIIVNSSGDVLQKYVEANLYILKNSGEKCFECSYRGMIDYFKRTQLNPDQWGRLWTYQTCTEFGYYQTSDMKVGNPFSHRFNLTFSLLQCKDIFGPEFDGKMVDSAVNEINIRNGAKDIKKPNIIIVNGSIDPWYALSILNDTTPQTTAVLIQGTAHCANMYPARAEDPPQLTEARMKITTVIQEWLSQSP